MGDMSFRTGLLIGGLAVAVVGLALALILTSGDGDGDGATTKTVAATETTTEPPPTEPATVTAPPVGGEVAFVTPSQNIVCRIDAESASCGVLEFTYEPPPQPPSCELSGWGHSLTVGTSGPGDFECRGDPPASLDSPVLPYGERVAVGPFACASDPSGVVCLNRETSHGFAVSRERFGRH